LAARGFGSSGTVGTGLRSVALAKAGAEGSLEDRLAQYSLDENDKTLSAAENFGFANPGKDTSGVNVGAGSAFAGGLAGGLTAFLQQLNQAAAYGGGD
jgi:hypothetical protein